MSTKITRIGISKNPEDRKREWERDCPSLHNWRIIKHCSTRDEAQEIETRLGQKPGYESYPGGPKTEGPCSVYAFDYYQ